MIDKADIDHDGVISEEEFYLILTQQSRRSTHPPYHTIHLSLISWYIYILKGIIIDQLFDEDTQLFSLTIISLVLSF